VCSSDLNPDGLYQTAPMDLRHSYRLSGNVGTVRSLGFAVNQMRIAVVQDLNLNVAHAVLVVYIDGEGFVLDNQIEQVIAQSKVHHYRPYYTINENAWWLHKS